MKMMMNGNMIHGINKMNGGWTFLYLYNILDNKSTFNVFLPGWGSKITFQRKNLTQKNRPMEEINFST
jgi:hypothetical protein